MESIKHKIGKEIAAKILNGKTECFIRKGHRADACNNKLFAEVECKKNACKISFYPRFCSKNKKINCQPLHVMNF